MEGFLYNFNLSKKVTLMMAVLILLSSIGLGFVSIRLSSDALVNQAIESLSNSAADGVKIIEASIERDMKVFEELSNRETTKSMNWNIQRQSLAPEMERQGYLEIGVIGKDRIAHFVSDGSTTDLSDRDYVKKAFQGEVNISDVLISLVTNQAVVMLASPITENGEIVGALNARLDGGALSEITSNLGFGENGYAYLLGEDGTFYAYINNDFVMEQRNLFDEKYKEEFGDVAQAFQELGMGNKGVVSYEYKGEKRYMAVDTVPSTGWILAVGAYEKDMLSGISKLKFTMMLGVLIFMLIGTILAIFFSSMISKPIVEYSKKIDKFSRYDFSSGEEDNFKKYLHRKDEIGIIGNSLASMQESIILLIRQIGDMSQNVASSSEELTAISQQSSTAADEIANVIQDIARGGRSSGKKY